MSLTRSGRIEHHVPSQAGNLAGTQAGLDREQYDQLVAKWVTGGGGKNKEIVYLLIVKYLGLLACHAEVEPDVYDAVY
jgi:hypothetical protein